MLSRTIGKGDWRIRRGGKEGSDSADGHVNIGWNRGFCEFFKRKRYPWRVAYSLRI